MMRVNIFSVRGDSNEVTEDFWHAGFDGTRLKAAAGDWAHNIDGMLYVDRNAAPGVKVGLMKRFNGGVIGAQAVKNAISASSSTGHRLIRELNAALKDKYRELGVDPSDRVHAFTGYVTHLTADRQTMKVTAVGDVMLAADGKIVAGHVRKIDAHNARLRREYIEETGDKEGSFRHVLPQIMGQYRFQNVPDHELSYSAIDGTETLRDGVEVFEMPTPRHILIWTGGYVTPDSFTIDGLERKINHVYETDPFRCGDFPAVSYSKDDRTALEITELDKWDRLVFGKVVYRPCL